tara:strand:+ start:32 stop:154 length:123 start_codon:yes stop_codon:yes gene_type:complete
LTHKKKLKLPLAEQQFCNWKLETEGLESPEAREAIEKLKD